MQVNINLKFFILKLLQNGLFDCKDSRLQNRVWICVEPIKIISQSVKSIITSVHAIRIKLGYDLEHKFLKQLS